MKSFTIEIPQTVLDDLRDRLARTRLGDALPGDAWAHGMDRDYLEELCRYWRDDFDWRAQERALNRFDHFRTEIDGQGLHFLHARSKHQNALPLLITHGWPGSVLEFMKIIGPLTDPEAHGGSAEDAFHVVCPSLPGYGFSDPPGAACHVKRIAELEAKLMAELGYARYGAQGGDWGAIITTWLGALDAEHLAGIHLNMLIAPPPGASPEEGPTQDELAKLAALPAVQNVYMTVHNTNPDTLAFGLNDSPAGLASWIVHKFREWTDCGGDVESAFTRDELLANVTLYWVTETIASSLRIYYATNQAGLAMGPGRVEVPTGCAAFPGEPYRVPRSWMEAAFNVTRFTEMPRGGHFAALQVPELLVDDVRAFFRDVS